VSSLSTAVRDASPGRRTGPLRRRARQLCAALSGAFLFPAATGCYAYRQPPDGTLPIGGRVALGITDRGRVAVGEQVGPGALRIRGELVATTDSTYVVRVESVENLNGRTTKWSGEQVVISRDHVGTASEHRYSRGRTLLAMSGVAVGVALAATAITLNTSGREGGGGKLPPGNGEQQ
jgi:hypothetical protein